MTNLLEESSSNNCSSIEDNIISSNSENINSSDFLNNPEQFDKNNIKGYKVEIVDFSLGNDSLISYYDNFYS